MHPLAPIALVGAQVLDGYEGAPISDGVIICEDDDIISDRLYYGDSMHQKWLDRVPLPDFWWWDEEDIRFSTKPVSLRAK